MLNAYGQISRQKRKIAVAVLSFAVTLFLSDVGLRIYFGVQDERIRTGMRLLYSPLYASIAEPGAEGYHSTEEFRVFLRANAEGFRERDGVSPGSKFVALLGDSMVWGTGVEENERFSNILTRDLEIKVANYGLPTAGTLNELAIYRDFVASKRPCVVILAFFPNDVQNNVWWLSDFAPGREDDENRIVAALERRAAIATNWPDENKLVVRYWYSSALLHLVGVALDRIARPAVEESIVFQLSDGRSFKIGRSHVSDTSNWSAALIEYPEIVSRGWRLTEAALAMLRREAEHDGAEFILAYLPYQERVHPDHWARRKEAYRLVFPDTLADFDRPRDRLAAFASAQGMQFLDLTAGLRKAAAHDSESLYFPLDGHLTPKGNLVVAGLIREFLAGNLPGACR